MKESTGNRGTILIVDDDPAVLTVIQHLLMAADYRVLLAAERADAIRLAAQKHLHIDVALLDIRIPGVSGTELADEIRAIRPNLKVLWMSGFIDEDIIRIKMLDGYAGFLAKPLHSAGLVRAIEEAMDGHPAERALVAGAVGW